MKLDSGSLRQNACTADTMKIQPIDLHITLGYDSGAESRVMLEENGDLSSILREGCKAIPEAPSVPVLANGGMVLVALDVDGGEYDGVYYEGNAENAITAAIEALVACRDAIIEVKDL
jgi:hypothetical protein